MFKPIVEYVEGAVCDRCFGIGKTFGDIPTPKRVTMTGSGFIGVEAVCNGTFILTQDGGNPHRWLFDDGVAAGEWTHGVANTLFRMLISGGGDTYWRLENLCDLISTFAGETVSIEIDEPPTPEYKFTIDQNFSPSLHTHYLALGAADTDEVSVVARRRDQVKLHFRFSPEY